jgi:pimeloyl-ACP methyl ester carboxylesterase
MPGTAERLGGWCDTSSHRSIHRWLRDVRLPEGYGVVPLASCVVRYRSHGRGARTVVLAADPPIVLEHYDVLVRAMGEGVRVVGLELPAFGFSWARRGFEFSLAGAVTAVSSFLDAIRVQDATLCFPCVSGFVALGVAAARPDLVRDLVLCQTPSYDGALAWKRSRDPRGILARPVVGQLAMHALKRKRAPAWLSLAVGDRSQTPWIQHIAEDKLRQGSRWSLASAFQQFLVEGAAPPRAVCPVTAVWGTRDGSHAATDRRGSLELGRDVRLLEWDDVGHFADLEAPERFAALLRGEAGRA